MFGTAEFPSVAVVGSGPSGLYTAATILRDDERVRVDVIDRLPAPYGLVRYGVAPDHATIKTVTRVLARPFADGRVRFLGNVEVGRQLTHADLVARYDAVVYATGSQLDRPLGVPDEDLRGSIGSARLVGWYSGHPDAEPVDLGKTGVVVVGGGNVALDIARVLARPAADLRSTDVPGQVLAALEASRVTDVNVLIRRGPADTKFSYLELLSLDELDDVDLMVHDDVRAALPDDLGTGPEADRIRRNIELFSRWQDAAPTGRPRRIHFHFRRRVDRLLGDEGRVVAVKTSATGGSMSASETLAAGLVVRAIGYDATPLPGLPFDVKRGLVPNEAGRVVAGVYVAGWCKRGATGVIATNKKCATETATAVLADLSTLAGRGLPEVPPGATDWSGWLRLDEHEREAGVARGAERVKSADLDWMVAVASGEALHA